MGYLIISRVARDGVRDYCAWMPDENRVFSEMERWLASGDTLEILEYCPNSSYESDSTDPGGRVSRVQRWKQHFRKAGDPCRCA